MITHRCAMLFLAAVLTSGCRSTSTANAQSVATNAVAAQPGRMGIPFSDLLAPPHRCP